MDFNFSGENLRFFEIYGNIRFLEFICVIYILMLRYIFVEIVVCFICIIVDFSFFELKIDLMCGECLD